MVLFLFSFSFFFLDPRNGGGTARSSARTVEIWKIRDNRGAQPRARCPITVVQGRRKPPIRSLLRTARELVQYRLTRGGVALYREKFRGCWKIGSNATRSFLRRVLLRSNPRLRAHTDTRMYIQLTHTEYTSTCTRIQKKKGR